MSEDQDEDLRILRVLCRKALDNEATLGDIRDIAIIFRRLDTACKLSDLPASWRRVEEPPGPIREALLKLTSVDKPQSTTTMELIAVLAEDLRINRNVATSHASSLHMITNCLRDLCGAGYDDKGTHELIEELANRLRDYAAEVRRLPANSPVLRAQRDEALRERDEFRKHRHTARSERDRALDEKERSEKLRKAVELELDKTHAEAEKLRLELGEVRRIHESTCLALGAMRHERDKARDDAITFRVELGNARHDNVRRDLENLSVDKLTRIRNILDEEA